VTQLWRLGQQTIAIVPALKCQEPFVKAAVRSTWWHAGVPMGEACTIVLRGASTHILDEAERSLHDALCVLQATVKVRTMRYSVQCSYRAPFEVAMGQIMSGVQVTLLFLICGFP
jgi:chaperonin GroEL (HSP60 family)